MGGARRREFGCAVVALWFGAVCATAAAAGPAVFGAPVPVGFGQGGRLVARQDGSVTAAWTVVERTAGFFDGPTSASRSTVFVASRAPGAVTFQAAQRVASIEAFVDDVSVARGADGSLLSRGRGSCAAPTACGRRSSPLAHPEGRWARRARCRCPTASRRP